MRILSGVVVIIMALVIGRGISLYYWLTEEIARMHSDDPAIWEKEIMDISDKNNPQNSDSESVLFVGSSSFRFWHSMAEDLKPLKVVNNGFGGAKLPDVHRFKEQLIYAYRPQQIVLFLGSNDISGHRNDKSPGAVYVHYKKLVLDIHRRLPETKIYILSITPTVARRNVWPEVSLVNRMLEHYSKEVDWLTFIDLQGLFLTDQQKPAWKYFKWDGTHLNREGYRLWANAIKGVLLKDCDKEMAYY